MDNNQLETTGSSVGTLPEVKPVDWDKALANAPQDVQDRYRKIVEEHKGDPIELIKHYDNLQTKLSREGAPKEEPPKTPQQTIQPLPAFQPKTEAELNEMTPSQITAYIRQENAYNYAYAQQQEQAKQVVERAIDDLITQDFADQAAKVPNFREMIKEKASQLNVNDARELLKAVARTVLQQQNLSVLTRAERESTAKESEENAKEKALRENTPPPSQVRNEPDYLSQFNNSNRR